MTVLHTIGLGHEEKIVIKCDYPGCLAETGYTWPPGIVLDDKDVKRQSTEAGKLAKRNGWAYNARSKVASCSSHREASR